MGWSWWALGNRPAVFPVLAAVVGVALGPLLALPWWLWFSTAAGLLALSAWRGARVGGVLLGLAGALCLGGWLAELHVDVDPPRVGVPVVFEAEVERVTPHGLAVNVTSVDDVPTRFRASLSISGSGLREGQRLRAVTKFHWVQPAANPGEWSRSVWAWRRGQLVTGSVSPARVVTLSAAPAWRRWLADAHRSLGETVRGLSDDEAATALLLTLAAGERAELGDALEDTFSRSGLAHVLSVSGLHVAVLAFTLFALLRWLLTRKMWLRRIDPRALAAPLSLPLIWAYVVFTGLQAPAVRSGLMCSLLLCAHLPRRRSDPLNAIALAALVMLAIDPSSLFELSVQLSFIAVLALVLLAPLLRDALPVASPSPATQQGWRLRVARWRETALQTFAASLAVTLASGPLMALAFQRVSLAGLVSNVATLPLSGLLTLVSASGAALHVVWSPLAVPVLWLGVQLSRAFIFVAELFAALPGATGALAAPGVWVMLAWWLGLAVLVLARGRWRWLSLAAPLALAVHLTGPREAGLSVTFLSVGHGDAIVVSSGGHHALIDAGGVPNGSDPGRRVVLPFLRQQRIGELDLTVLTHAHPDHALGLLAVLDEVPTKRLWLHDGIEEGELVDEVLAAAGDAQVEERCAGAPDFTLGDAVFSVRSPCATGYREENDASLVLLLRHGDVSFLFTGDIEAETEATLDVGEVTVMKAPHHGSDTSSTAPFIARTRPKHVVFCVGRNSRFNFPREGVVRRWERAGAQCHRTDLDGAITFTSDGHDVTVDTFFAAPRQARRSAAPPSQGEEQGHGDEAADGH